MANVVNMDDLFPEELVTDIFNAVKGKSSLATLHAAEPISFTGQRQYVFSMDKEIDIVAESGKKSNGGMTLTPVTINPIKIEYGGRVSDEFMYASNERRIELLSTFSDGFANKLARGLDLAAMHGYNPRTGAASTVIGPNYFDNLITNKSGEDETADASVEDVIELVQNGEYDVNGIAMAPSLRTALAKLMNGDTKMYPELAWGAAPSVINGLPASVNTTVSAYDIGDLAIVGDFQNAFKWGYAKDITFETIEYGNPDNDEEAGDLKGANQVYLRAEAYIGWGILDPAAFAILNSNEAAPTKLNAAKTTSAKASK